MLIQNWLSPCSFFLNHDLIKNSLLAVISEKWVYFYYLRNTKCEILLMIFIDNLWTIFNIIFCPSVQSVCCCKSDSCRRIQRIQRIWHSAQLVWLNCLLQPMFRPYRSLSVHYQTFTYSIFSETNKSEQFFFISFDHKKRKEKSYLV